MNYRIRMYYELSDSELADLYREAERDGVFDWVCHDWNMNESIFGVMARRAAVFAVVYDDAGQALTFFFLTDFRGLSAQIHFAFLKRGRKARREIGRLALNWCFETFEFRCLIGLVPVINRAACWYAGEVGGRKLGVIPGGCWIERLRKTVDGAMFIFERTEE